MIFKGNFAVYLGILVLVTTNAQAQAQEQVQSATAPAVVTPTVAAPTVLNASTASWPTWVDKISFSGDLKLRFEHQKDAVSTTSATGKDRNTRARVRGRLKVTGKINENMEAVMRVTTGNVGRAPSSYSTYANLGQANSKKDFNLDLVYMGYKPLPGLLIQVGKAPNLFWEPGSSEIVWGWPMTQEGGNVQYVADFGIWKPFFTISYSSINASGGGVDYADTTMLGAQFGVPIKTEVYSFTAAIGSYGYSSMKGAPISNFYSGTPTSADGNTVVGGAYANGYNLLDAGVELGFKLGFAPLSFYYHRVQNEDAQTKNQGDLIGTKLGALKEVGTWFVEYNYRNVEADAALAYAGETYFLLTGTDVRGHVIRTAYQAWVNAALGLEYNGGTRSGMNGELFMLDLFSNF